MLERKKERKPLKEFGENVLKEFGEMTYEELMYQGIC
jgi:hypothetical protein